MEHPYLFLNTVFSWFGLELFAKKYPWVVYTWLVMIVLIVLAFVATRTLKLVPKGGQNFFEAMIGGLEDFMVDVMGEHGRPYFPLIGTLFLFIFTMNIWGLIPGQFGPTSNPNTTLAMALCVFLIFQTVGVMKHGPKYIKHFMGPVWWLAPLMIPIEIIGHLSRVLSLTFRLFGNILAEDLVLLVLFVLVGQFFIPLAIMPLFLFADFVQAFIFTMLTMMYIAGSLEEAH